MFSQIGRKNNLSVVKMNKKQLTAMSLTPEQWRVAVWNFFEPGYLRQNNISDADLEDTATRQQVDDIFNSLNNGDADFVRKALPAIETVSGRQYNGLLNEGKWSVRASLLADLQRSVRLRTCQLGLPELVRNPGQTRMQGRVLRTTNTGEQISLPIHLSLETDFNDIQLSADGKILVTAGAGTQKNHNFIDGTANRRQKCEEVEISGGTEDKQAGATTETYDGINIYIQQACNKNVTCTGLNQNFEWVLVQSLLVGATITRLHVNKDGSGIVAYAGYDNNLFIVRQQQQCSRGTGDVPLWSFQQGLDLELGDDQDVYALCHSMHASQDQSIIVCTNKNLTTNLTRGWVLTNGVGCSRSNQRYEKFVPTGVTAERYEIVQRIENQDTKYQRATVSRDGSTLLLEYGPPQGVDADFLYFNASDPRIHFLGLRVYHWEENRFGMCQFKLRQTIEYDGMPSDYNEQRLEYDDCITGHTQELFFAGANDNRIIRISIRGRMARDQLLNYVYPALQNPDYFSAENQDRLQQGNVAVAADSEVLQVFDRPAELLDLCGKKVKNCKDGIINVGPLSVRRGEFVPFVAKPYVELKGFDIIPAIPDGLYTHPTNAHIFMLADKNSRQLHVYVETEKDNVWTKIPSSKFEPLQWQAHSGGGRIKGFRGYMTLMDNASCEEQNTVCVPYNDQFIGRFVLRTVKNGTGRYDGIGEESEIGNFHYLNQADHFIISQFGTDRPFLANFPTRRTVGQDPKLFPAPGNPDGFFPPGIAAGKGAFTLSPPFAPQPAPEPLPGCAGVPNWPCIPFPLDFIVWQSLPADDDRFPQCREAYRRLTPQDPFVLVACKDEVEIVLTPRYIDFNVANANKPTPNPNFNPEYIFARAKAPVYNGISIVCFDFDCHEQLCRANCSLLPEFFKTTEIEACQCGERPTNVFAECVGDGIRVTWRQVPSFNNIIKVQRRIGNFPGTPWTEFTTFVDPPRFDDNNVLPNTTYCYRIATCDADGKRTTSNIVCAQTAPAAPTNVFVFNVGISTADVSWTNVQNPADVQFITVFASTGQFVIVGPADTMATVTGLPPNTNISFRVVTTAFSGKTAGSDNVAAMTQPALNLQIVNPTIDSLTLTWDDRDDEVGYQVKRDGVVIADLPADTTEFIDSTTEPDVTYCYTICVLLPEAQVLPSEEVCGGQIPSNAKWSSQSDIKWSKTVDDELVSTVAGNGGTSTMQLDNLCGPATLSMDVEFTTFSNSDRVRVLLDGVIFCEFADGGAGINNPSVLDGPCQIAIGPGAHQVTFALIRAGSAQPPTTATIKNVLFYGTDITPDFDQVCGETPNVCFTTGITPAKWSSPAIVPCDNAGQFSQQGTPQFQVRLRAALNEENSCAILRLENVAGPTDIRFDYIFRNGAPVSEFEFRVDGVAQLNDTTETPAFTEESFPSFAITGAGPHVLEWQLSVGSNPFNVVQSLQIFNIYLGDYLITQLFDVECGEVPNVGAV